MPNRPLFKQNFYDSGPFVTINVGPSEEVEKEKRSSFFVYEKHLTHHSTFFRKALSGPWTESISRVIELPEDEPKVFQLFVQWLYTEDYAHYSDCAAPKEYHYKLYVFADKLQVPALKNCVIDNLINDQFLQDLIPFHEPDIRFVYKHTTEGSKLRLLTCAGFLSDMGSENEKELFLDSPPRVRARKVPDFYLQLFRMSLASNMWKPGVDLRKMRCHFHEHEEEKRCRS
ncbi:MAG: hypothetical protein M1821_001920 [Bathelium mastoideum]|nr:MAG: hypothetical protein M1821_001920 [Bathelium mastoideum]KAI9692430.1 MAG: hypothetical protein M1822_006661 [Bathelium mastoideum]